MVAGNIYEWWPYIMGLLTILTSTMLLFMILVGSYMYDEYEKLGPIERAYLDVRSAQFFRNFPPVGVEKR